MAQTLLRRVCHLIISDARESYQALTPLLALPQDMHIEVDENGTLDLSMKTKREKMKDQPSLPLPPPPPPPPPPPVLPAMSLGEGLPTPVTSMAKASGLHIPTAFYQALCEQEGWDVPLNFSKPHMQLEREVSVLAHARVHWESPSTLGAVAHCRVKCLSHAAV